MLIFPCEADVPFERRPFVNWLILILIIAVFWLRYAINQDVDGAQAREAIWAPFVLRHFSFTELIGYMWLQHTVFHVVGNVVFLRLFGNAVCQKIGNLIYFPLFVGFGVVAGIVHLLAGGSAFIGAGGAICGMAGMFLMFYPVNDVNFVWFTRAGIVTLSISGWWVVLLWLSIDAAGVMATGANWGACIGHLGGFAAGVVMGLTLLVAKLVPIDPNQDECILQVFTLGKERWGLDPSSSDGEAGQAQDQSPHATLDEPAAVGQDAKAAEDIRAVECVAPSRPQSPDEIIRFHCRCGQKIKMPVANIGSVTKCPTCSILIVIPSDD